jgi:hypothetical protein
MNFGRGAASGTVTRQSRLPLSQIARRSASGEHVGLQECTVDVGFPVTPRHTAGSDHRVVRPCSSDIHRRSGNPDSRCGPQVQPACNTGVVADARQDDNRGAPLPEPDSDLRRPGWQSTAADARARVARLLHRRIWPCSTADRQLLRTRRGPETTRLRRSRSRSRTAVSTTPRVSMLTADTNRARNYRIPIVAGFLVGDTNLYRPGRQILLASRDQLRRGAVTT